MQFVLSVKITGLVSTVPGLAVGPVLVPLIRPYMYCLLVSLTPFHHFFLTYLLPFPMRIDPLHYHRPDVVKERLNMALVFCLFCAFCAFLLIGDCVLLSYVRFSSFSTPRQEFGFGKRLRNDLFCVEWGSGVVSGTTLRALVLGRFSQK